MRMWGMRCSKCKTDKSDSEFGRDASKARGYSYHCKACAKERQDRYRAKPDAKARMRATQKAYNARPEIRLHQRERQKAYNSRPDVAERNKRNRVEYYAKNRDRRIAFERSYKDNNWDSRILASARSASGMRQARGRNCPCSLTIEDIRALWVAQYGLCYFTGIPLRKERHCLDTVSLDRLDPSKGYEPGNVVLAIKAMNFAKTGHSEVEFFALLEQLRWALPFKLTERRRLSVA